MKKLFLAAVVLALASFGFAQVGQDAHLSVHDIGVAQGSGPITFQGCKSCHVPHGGAIASDTTQPQRNTVWGTATVGDFTTGQNKLWDKLISTGSYQTYSSDKVTGALMSAPGTSTDPAWHSYLCFSCHDGTVAVLNIPSGTVASDNFLMNGGNGDIDLTNDHPVDIAWPSDTINYELPTAVTGATTTYNQIAMPLYGGASNKIECATCHNPHYQAAVANTGFRGNFLRIGTAANTPLVSDNTSLCRTCHLSKR
jgi:predicted outer membrane repeat protein